MLSFKIISFLYLYVSPISFTQQSENLSPSWLSPLEQHKAISQAGSTSFHKKSMASVPGAQLSHRGCFTATTNVHRQISHFTALYTLSDVPDCRFSTCVAWHTRFHTPFAWHIQSLFSTHLAPDILKCCSPYTIHLAWHTELLCSTYLAWCISSPYTLPDISGCCSPHTAWQVTYWTVVFQTSCLRYWIVVLHTPCLTYWTVVLYKSCLTYQFSTQVSDWHISLTSVLNTPCLTLDCCSPNTLPDISVLHTSIGWTYQPDISVLHTSIGPTYQPDISVLHTNIRLTYQFSTHLAWHTGLLFSKHLAQHIISPHMYWTDVSVFHTPCLTYWTVVLYMPWIPDFSTHLLPDVLDCWFPPIHQYLAYHVAASTLKTDGFNHYVLQTVFLISAPLGTKGYPPTWRQSMEYLCCLNLECHSKQQLACMETPYHASHQPMLQAAPSVWGLCQGELTVQQDVHSIGPDQWQCTSLDIPDFPTSVLPLAELCCWVQSSDLENQPTKKQNVWEILWRSIWTNLQKRDSTPYQTDFTEPHSQRYNVVQLQTMKVLSTWDRRRELSYSRAAKISMLGIKYSVASSVQVCPKITVRNIHFLTTGIHL